MSVKVYEIGKEFYIETGKNGNKITLVNERGESKELTSRDLKNYSYEEVDEAFSEAEINEMVNEGLLGEDESFTIDGEDYSLSHIDEETGLVVLYSNEGIEKILSLEEFATLEPSNLNEAGLDIVSGIEQYGDSDCFYLIINGKKYYYVMESKTPEELKLKYDSIAKYSQSKALMWVKKTTICLNTKAAVDKAKETRKDLVDELDEIKAYVASIQKLLDKESIFEIVYLEEEGELLGYKLPTVGVALICKDMRKTVASLKKDALVTKFNNSKTLKRYLDWKVGEVEGRKGWFSIYVHAGAMRNKGNQPSAVNVLNNKDVMYVVNSAGIDSDALTETVAKLILELKSKVESVGNNVVLYEPKSDSYIGKARDLRIKFPGDVGNYEDDYGNLKDDQIILIGFPDDGVYASKDTNDYIRTILRNTDLSGLYSEDLEDHLSEIVKGLKIEKR